MKKIFLTLFMLSAAMPFMTASAEEIMPPAADSAGSAVAVMPMPESEKPEPALSPEETAKSVQQITDEAYGRMVEESYTVPADFDFAKARDLYTRTSFYEPYLTNPRKSFENFMDRLGSGSNVVTKEVQTYMYHHFALPEAHSRAAVFFKKAGMMKAAKYHEWAAKGLVKAIRSGGNASSAEQAMKVVIISEQYLITESWGETSKKELRQIGENVYDVLTMVNPETGEEKQVWFDVTSLHDARRRKINEEGQSSPQ
jgi:hypothetical protein